MQAVGAGFSECETSGCTRSVGFGLVFLIWLVPIFVLVCCLLTFFLLQFGFKLINYKSRIGELFSLTILPYSATSLIFSILTNLIYEPGYQTDLRFLAFELVSIGLLVLNTILIVLSISFVCKVNWMKAIIASVPCIILFSIGIKIHLSYAEPYLHYLSDDNTYRLAKYYLIDKRTDNRSFY